MRASTQVETGAPGLPAGFAELYAESYDFLWRCALRLGADPASVEDVVQDSFIVALRRYQDFDADSGVRPTTWLFGILGNVIRNHARSERRRRARLERYRQMPRVEAQARTEMALAGRLVDEFLATLDPDKRAVFVLGELEGMTGPEIARALELNLNTANSRLRSARKAFARHFSDEGPAREALAELRRTRAPARARRCGLPAVAAAVGYPTTGVSAALFAGLGSKLVAGLIFAFACLGAGLILVAPGEAEQRELAEASTPEPRPPAPASSAAIPVVADGDEAEAEAEVEPAASASPPRAPALRGDTRSTRGQLDRLERARARIADDPAGALALVEGRSFDAGLEGRRAGLEIGALCRLGRQSEAERRARAWRAAHPDDPQASSFVAVCWTEAAPEI